MLFNKIKDSFAVTYSNGVFHQRPLYEREGFLFCSYGSGFIRIMKSGTSMPNIVLKDLVIDQPVHYPTMGYAKLKEV